MQRSFVLVLTFTLGLTSVRTVVAQTDDLFNYWPTPNGIESRPKPDNVLRAMGRERAEVEYRDGWAEIERFGMVLGGNIKWGDERGYGGVYIDKDTGLYFRDHGCIVNGQQQRTESEAYNKRITELVAINGPPQKAKGLMARFDRLRKLMERDTDFKWVPLPWSNGHEKPTPTKVGPFDVIAEVVPSPVSDELKRKYIELGFDHLLNDESRVRVMRGDKTVVTQYADERHRLSLTFLPELDILILKRSASSVWLTFIDTRHGRRMCYKLYNTTVIHTKPSWF